MEAQTATEKAQELSDVELAMLLSLVAKEHCIIQTEPEDLDALENEIKLVWAFERPSST